MTLDEKLDLRPKGSSIAVRAYPPRLRDAAVELAAAVSTEEKEPSEARYKRPRLSDPENGGGIVPFGVPPLAPEAPVPAQIVRISAGRAASASGIHPYTNEGDFFLSSCTRTFRTYSCGTPRGLARGWAQRWRLYLQWPNGRCL